MSLSVDGFGSTHWSVIDAAAAGGTPGAREAMARLCAQYWYPLYAYVRRQGVGEDEARDLTQEFFARQFVSGNVLKGVSAERGRFRAWLLASLKHLLSNEWDRKNTLKRGAGCVHLPLDAFETAEGRYQAEPALPADKLYDRAWAMTLLAKVRERLRQEYEAKDKGEAFEVLKAFLPGEDGGSLAEAAARLGKKENAVKQEVFRLRQRFGDALREEIRRTVSCPLDVEEELRELISIFSE
jgi:RNA polymerase sigma-70 factor (ECF subfamily)